VVHVLAAARTGEHPDERAHHRSTGLLDEYLLPVAAAHDSDPPCDSPRSGADPHHRASAVRRQFASRHQRSVKMTPYLRHFGRPRFHRNRYDRLHPHRCDRLHPHRCDRSHQIRSGLATLLALRHLHSGAGERHRIDDGGVLA
jgi:hypothetical protein